jgi:hypothetical protein
MTDQLREQTRPIQMLSRLRAHFLAVGAGHLSIGVTKGIGLKCVKNDACLTGVREAPLVSWR